MIRRRFVLQRADNGEEVQPIRVQVAVYDAENKKLGTRSEEWILEVEKRRLTEVGRTDLAAKVVWVSENEGDTVGCDIRSFDDDGNQIHIEVKTTNSSKNTDFFITAHELAVADRIGKGYRLYRVFDFSCDPKFYVLTGPLASKLNLTVRSFSARCKN